MNILITSAASTLAKRLADQLALNHKIRLTEREFVKTEHQFFQNALGHDETLDQLVVGIDAVLHVAEPLAADDEFSLLDYMTRCTYNLLMAATSAEVGHFIYVSSLDLLKAYPSHYRVDERWKPKPTPEPAVLGKHLGEYVCREFARERKARITVVRQNCNRGAPHKLPLGRDEPEPNVDQLVQLVEQSLTEQTSGWTIRHVVAETLSNA